MFTHGSLFAGIEGFGLGFERAGFQLRWQVERDKFCRRVLRSHWPAVHRFADVRRVGAHNLKPVDCITAGVPCQDVSVAGKRAGLAGERTGLFYEFARILRELRPAWFVFENVPGLFSSNGGRDFAEVLRVLMVECGYGVAWRVLDSRYFGVAQRRRRVFIVGRFGEPCPASILFDSASGEGDFAARRKERARVAAPLTHGSGVTGNAPGRRREDGENIVSTYRMRGFGDCEASDSASAIKQRDWRDATDLIAAPITSSRERGDGQDNLIAIALKSSDDHRISAEGAFNLQVAYALRNDPGGIGQGHNTTFAVATLNSGGNAGGFRTEPGEHLVSAPPDADGVRDFAGLPEGMDSARYRALGNAVTVQVAEWIGRRIVAASDLGGQKMTAASSLRLARIRKGLTLDDLFLCTKGKLSPSRLSRIERGLCVPTQEESALLVRLLDVDEQTITEGR